MERPWRHRGQAQHGVQAPSTETEWFKLSWHEHWARCYRCAKISREWWWSSQIWLPTEVQCSEVSFWNKPGFLPGAFPKSQIFIVYPLWIHVKESSEERKEMQCKSELSACAVRCLQAACCPSPGARRQRCLLPCRRFSLVLPWGAATRRLQLQNAVTSAMFNAVCVLHCCATKTSASQEGATRSLQGSPGGGAGPIIPLGSVQLWIGNKWSHSSEDLSFIFHQQTRAWNILPPKLMCFTKCFPSVIWAILVPSQQVHPVAVNTVGCCKQPQQHKPHKYDARMLSYTT